MKKNKQKNLFKVFCILGSSLLIIMALFHGSGFFYISESIETSNAEGFLKDIVPLLFVHPSLHLIALASLGFLTLVLTSDAGKVLRTLSIIVIVDALLAFYLGAWLPGVLLTLSTLFYALASVKHKKLL